MAESPNLNGGGVVRLSLFCDGSALEDNIQVASVNVIKSVNKLPFAKIVLLDGDIAGQDFPVSNSNHFKPGAEIKVNAGYGDDEETIFEGIVIRHGIKISGDNDSRLVIECRDKAVAMTVGRKNANYIDSRDSDVITTLIGHYSGLSASVEATTTEHKELVQYYSTDWDFMLSRAEANGMLVCVDDAAVTVGPPKGDEAAVLKVTYGEDLLEFSADLDARSQLASVATVAWDSSKQEISSEDVTAVTVGASGNLASAELAKVIGLDKFRLQSPVPQESAALTNWAKGQQLKAALARIRGRMKFQGSALAKIGGMVELAGVGERFNGNLYVSVVEHEIANGQWSTRVDFGMSDNWFAQQRDLVAPPASGLLPGVEGLQVGVVMKLDEDPASEFKIQVKLPIMEAEQEGVWARLANFYASEGIGAFFIPEIGDEVVLGYLNNDPNNPVVLGSLYSSKRAAPYELTADNYTKALVTKEQLKIEFDDEKKVITIVTPGGNTAILNDDEKSILLQDQNGNKVELAEGGITLDSPKDINITAMGKINIEATDAVAVSSLADVTVEGLNVSNKAQVGFTAEGSATAELTASGQTTIKGAMVMIN
ncbi:MAG: type VI secretion system tip protein VgrG [Gammaproteobacteria bacterium]|nr:type VI secretion system tip protein VgrG [Gammaproteobacteria bacterium]MCF6260309.1 type VI secretion system tip protein VgrG [Gammaproteobacteria bacterium]